LKNGLHNIKFDVNDAFFHEFEQSPIINGDFEVNLELDKRPDLSIAKFSFEGVAHLICDRCLSPCDLAVEGEYTLHIKFGETQIDEDEVMFIDVEQSHINFAQFIYESICLSLPIILAHEDENDCDQEMISKMTKISDEVENNTDEDLSVWQSLKELRFDKNKEN
jgi:uncharacterized metal-binding protein YceD (DUF177 family)